MTSIVIRDVPEDVHDVLVSRAESAGQSLQKYTLQMIVDNARRKTQREVLDEIARRAEKFPPVSREQLLADLYASREEDAA